MSRSSRRATLPIAGSVQKRTTRYLVPTYHTIISMLSLGYKEEDFVTNLYNRTLLTNIDEQEIHHLLEEARKLLRDPSLPYSDNLRSALTSRIEFRWSFLEAVAFDATSGLGDQGSFWEEALESLPTVIDSNKYGLKVENCISSKVQRRLASSVPPRPIVLTEWKVAHQFLKRLCEDGISVENVLLCPRGSHIFVSSN